MAQREGRKRKRQTPEERDNDNGNDGLNQGPSSRKKPVRKAALNYRSCAVLIVSVGFLLSLSCGCLNV